MSTSTVPKEKQASSQDIEADTQLDASVSTHDEGDEEESAENPTPESDDESDEEVLRNIGSVKGEELLAFFDEVRNAYQIDTSSLSLPQVSPNTNFTKPVVFMTLKKISWLLLVAPAAANLLSCRPSLSFHSRWTMASVHSLLLKPRFIDVTPPKIRTTPSPSIQRGSELPFCPANTQMNLGQAFLITSKKIWKMYLQSSMRRIKRRQGTMEMQGVVDFMSRS